MSSKYPSLKVLFSSSHHICKATGNSALRVLGTRILYSTHCVFGFGRFIMLTRLRTIKDSSQAHALLHQAFTGWHVLHLQLEPQEHLSPQLHLPLTQFPQPSLLLALQVVHLQSGPHLQLSPQLHCPEHAAQVIFVNVENCSCN